MNPAPDATVETVVTIAHPQGLHLRTGKELVRIASGFSAEIRATNLSRPSAQVNVKSILQLMQLQAQYGHQLRITATGSDAPEALVALTVFIEGFSPKELPQQPESQLSTENLRTSESQQP
jgi:phosphotransferase system HPr (HPr) family protein